MYMWCTCDGWWPCGHHISVKNMINVRDGFKTCKYFATGEVEYVMANICFYYFYFVLYLCFIAMCDIIIIKQ